MTIEQMRRAISIEAEARKIKRHFDQWVLLKMDSASHPEVINVGDPVDFRKNEYHRMKVAIPDAVRRLAFRQWRKELALEYNKYVRELAQLGVHTDLSLIAFSSSTGEPL